MMQFYTIVIVTVLNMQMIIAMFMPSNTIQTYHLLRHEYDMSLKRSLAHITTVGKYF